MITRETDYAIRAMVFLAVQPDSKAPVSSADMADTMKIPYRFLRKIVLKLIAAGLVESRRGKGGGLNMAVDPATVSLFDIMRAVDPNGLCLNVCLEDPAQCKRSFFCGLHEALLDVQSEYHTKLQSVMLDKVSEPDKARILSKI